MENLSLKLCMREQELTTTRELSRIMIQMWNVSLKLYFVINL